VAAVFRRVFRVLRLLLVLVLALAVGAILVFTLTGKGRENLAGLVSDLASSETSKVRIGGLDGIWSGHLTLGHVVLEDAAGPWMVARDVDVDWSPLSLLSSTFDADRVSAARIEIARLPESRGGEGGGGLPVDIAVRALDLPDIALGEEIAGGIARLSAAGSVTAKAEPLDVDIDLSLARTDGRDGAVAAKIRFAPSKDVLDIDVRGSEPAGGVVANLLRLPGAPAVSFSMTGKGPADDWKGEGRFSVDGEVVTTLKGGYRQADGTRHVAVEGKGSFERFVPEALRPLLAGDTAFDVAAALGAAGGVTVERATLESSAATVQRGSDFSLELAARGNPVTLSLGEGPDAVTVAVERAAARAFGDGSAPMVDVTASLPRLSAAGNVATAVEATLHSDAFTLATQTGPVEVSLKAADVEPAEAALRPFLAGPISATAAGTVGQDAIAIDKASLSGSALRADFSGEVSRGDGSLRLAVEADVDASALPGAARRVAGDRVALAATLARDFAEVRAAHRRGNGRTCRRNARRLAEGRAGRRRPSRRGRLRRDHLRRRGDGQGLGAGRDADGRRRPHRGHRPRHHRPRTHRLRRGRCGQSGGAGDAEGRHRRLGPFRHRRTEDDRRPPRRRRSRPVARRQPRLRLARPRRRLRAGRHDRLHAARPRAARGARLRDR